METIPTVEDYLKTIFYLQKDDEVISTSSLVKKLEHYASEDIMKNIEQILGEREFGIHGKEIPV